MGCGGLVNIGDGGYSLEWYSLAEYFVQCVCPKLGKMRGIYCMYRVIKF